MIIHPDEYSAYKCPLSMASPPGGFGLGHPCIGPECMAWEPLPGVPDKDVILEEKVQEHSPGHEWYLVPGEMIGPGKGYTPSKFVKYQMIPRATCGMLPKDEINVYTQS